MRSAAGFLSTMSRNLGDPTTATKLIHFIEEIRGGSDITTAARAAGLELRAAKKFLDAVSSDLERSIRAVPKRRAAPQERSGDGLRLVAVSDGASRGNPGRAACAAILYDDNGEELLRRSQGLGVTTNNVAEYRGVILALELAKTLEASELLLKLDSELVVKQLNGEYKVKHPSLKPLYEEARDVAKHFAHFEIVHVPRTETAEADKLANDELDGKE